MAWMGSTLKMWVFRASVAPGYADCGCCKCICSWWLTQPLSAQSSAGAGLGSAGSSSLSDSWALSDSQTLSPLWGLALLSSSSLPKRQCGDFQLHRDFSVRNELSPLASVHSWDEHPHYPWRLLLPATHTQSSPIKHTKNFRTLMVLYIFLPNFRAYIFLFLFKGRIGNFYVQ